MRGSNLTNRNKQLALYCRRKQNWAVLYKNGILSKINCGKNTIYLYFYIYFLAMRSGKFDVYCVASPRKIFFCKATSRGIFFFYICETEDAVLALQRPMPCEESLDTSSCFSIVGRRARSKLKEGIYINHILLTWFIGIVSRDEMWLFLVSYRLNLYWTNQHRHSLKSRISDA